MIKKQISNNKIQRPRDEQRIQELEKLNREEHLNGGETLLGMVDFELIHEWQ